MQITIKLYGDLKKYATHTKPARWEGRLADGSSISDIIDRIGCPRKKVVRIFRDGLPVQLSAGVRDGDVLYFLSHLGGG